MTPEEILEAALLLPLPERAAFLARECTTDELRSELESFLALHTQHPEFLRIPRDREEPPPPRSLGPYTIVREIGRGGMGVVYLAEDPKLKRLVALKVLPHHLGNDAAARARFQREAQLLAALNHPNIATIHSFEEAGGVHFLTMEYIDGVSLAERIAAAPLPLDRALVICRQIARAVEAAHEKNIIHRDLKPANVILGSGGRVRVLDFGLARSYPSGSSGAVPGPGLPQEGRGSLIAGTPGYMSPEQLLGSRVDQRTDVWAFGCLLYECLTGRPAFSGEPRDGSGGGVAPEQPDWSLLSGAPARIAALAHRCLAREPGRRENRMREVRREIDEELADRSLLRRRVRSERSRQVRPGSLPHPMDRFIGRALARKEIRRLLGRTRLLTLTGPGGCGKTRLALEAGRERESAGAGDVWLVDLSAVTDGSLLAGLILGALTGGTEPRKDAPAGTARLQEIDKLKTALQGRPALLLLDHCEHVRDACRDLARELLESCPRLRLLVTSREALGLPGEALYRVLPLEVPVPGSMPLQKLRCFDAVRLFTERARAADPSFRLTGSSAAAVGEVCRRLDGIPLALELAAATIPVLPLEEMAARLRRLVDEGVNAQVPWQGTLAGLVEWSHGLLSPDEQKIYRRLSVFSGGWSLGAAEDVCSGGGVESWEVLDLLSHLMNKSMLERDVEGSRRAGRTRYRMLETMRLHAAGKLRQSGESAAVRRRHLDHFLGLALESEPHLTGGDQREWIARLEVEHDNLRAALASSLDPEVVAGSGGEDAQDSEGTPVDPTPGLDLAGSLGRFWMNQGHWTEGRRLLGRVLAAAASAHPAGLPPFAAGLARALHWAANLAECQGDLEEAERQSEESLRLWRALGDSRNAARLLNNIANVAQRRGDRQRAAALYKEGLAIHRERNDRIDIAHSLNNLGTLAAAGGDFETARARLEESVEVKRELQDRVGVAGGLQNLGALAGLQRDYSAARAFLQEALSIFRETGQPSACGTVLANLGEVEACLGHPTEATSFLRESLAVRWELGDLNGLAESLEALAEIEAKGADPMLAARLLGAADALRSRAGSQPAARREDQEHLAPSAPEKRSIWEASRLVGRAMAVEEAVGLALGRTR